MAKHKDIKKEKPKEVDSVALQAQVMVKINQLVNSLNEAAKLAHIVGVEVVWTNCHDVHNYSLGHIKESLIKHKFVVLPPNKESK